MKGKTVNGATSIGGKTVNGDNASIGGKTVNQRVREALRPIHEKVLPDGNTVARESRLNRCTEYLVYMNDLNEYIDTAVDHYITIGYTEEVLDRLTHCINSGEPYRPTTTFGGLNESRSIIVTNHSRFEHYKRLMPEVDFTAIDKIRTQYQQLIDAGRIPNYVTIVCYVGHDHEDKLMGVNTIIPTYFDSGEELIRSCQSKLKLLSQNEAKTMVGKLLKPWELIQLTAKVMLPRRYECRGCGKTNAKKKCSSCQLSYYCTRECQEKDWNEHKRSCFDNRVLAALVHLKC